jgi:cytochrome c peroxidase
MWNGRFASVSDDPFDNSQGFLFPQPEGVAKFPPHDPEIKHLLAAQGFIPQTELAEMSGFTGTRGTVGSIFDVFDDGHGAPVPLPDNSGFRNEPIREAVLARFNTNPDYRMRFGAIFPAVRNGGMITFLMISQTLAEFQISLTFANAPIDRFARGEWRAMTQQQKKGALLFFGQAGCVQCHAVAGPSNEMFSDFKMHAIGVPQIAPFFGTGLGNVLFDGAGQNEDFGLEQFTGNTGDRYRFRTSPLRNVALQPTFFHNGAFTRLDDAVRHHLDVFSSARHYNPSAAGIDPDLTQRIGPVEPVLAQTDPRLAKPIRLTESEFQDLVVFVRDGLLDPRAKPERLCALVPKTVPSRMLVAAFERCRS